MAFSYLTNVPLEKAKSDYIELLTDHGFGPESETVSVQSACGRGDCKGCLCRDLRAALQAAMRHWDGIAIKAKDSFGATDTTPVTLAAGQFAVVDTGDPIPAGLRRRHNGRGACA